MTKQPMSEPSKQTMYAQTIIQLYKQLQIDGYSDEDLILIRNAYELAMEVTSGNYRPSGKTNMAHFIGTASILSSLGASIEAIAAGLLHSIYAHGDFGTLRKGISEAKRRQVRRAVGEKVEEYLAKYAALEWSMQTAITIRETLPNLDPVDRTVVLVRLADRLEDYLDLGILYCPNAEDRLRGIQNDGQLMIELAVQLGYPTLAAEFETVFKESADTDFPAAILRNPASRNPGFLVAPRSYRRPLLVAIYQELEAKFLFLRSQIFPWFRRLPGRVVRRLRRAGFAIFTK